MARLSLQSMFHRRLLLLLALTTLGLAVLTGQLARLTLVHGDALLEQAERPLVAHRWIDTQRGRILDRKGRVLASDRPSFDVEVHYSVITGARAYADAAEEARRSHADEWSKLGEDARDALIRRYLPSHVARIERMWTRLAQIAGLERSEIEERRNRIVERTQRLATSVWEKRRLARMREWSASRERLAEPPTLADVARPIREQVEPHVVLRGVRDRAAFDLRRLAEDYPDLLRVIDGGRRSYPFESVDVAVDLRTFPRPLREEAYETVTVEGVATHLLGWMRDKVYAEDMRRRPLRDPETGAIDPGHYREGDSVGAQGLEAALEDDLRGDRGRLTRQLDTDEREVVEPAPGGDARLTIDVMLQARILAAMRPELGLTRVQPWHGNRDVPLDEELASAAVVLEVATGEVLAMASHPTFTRARKDEAPESVFDDPLTAPWVNRAVGRPYAAASIVKPLVLCEAVSRGVHSLSRGIECHGHFYENRPGIYRCWIYRPRFGMLTHTAQTGGALLGPEAIARSCNIYFYTLGRALGPDGMAALYRRLGVERPYDLRLAGATAGFIGRLGGAAIERNEAIMMAIGQGPISWTPLHAADAYATMARRGLRIEPTLVRDASHRPGLENLGWDARAVDAALEGLRMGVEEGFGTSNHITYDTVRDPIFTAEGVTVVAKTGTGQASPTLGEDPDGDGPAERPVLRRGDHAWAVALAGPAGAPPEYAIAVVTEHGGSGGRVSGPIANQVVHALQAEGYLPRADGSYATGGGEVAAR